MTGASLFLVTPEHLQQDVASDGPPRHREHGEKCKLGSPSGERRVLLTGMSQQRQAAEGYQSEVIAPQHVEAVRCG